MPIRRFWSMNACIDRIQAEDDLRAIAVAVSVQGQESYQEAVTRLRKQMGEVAIYNEAARSINMEYDRAGLLALKDMGSVR